MITPDAQAAIAAQLRACGVSDTCPHCGGTEHEYLYKEVLRYTPYRISIERLCQGCGALAFFARDFGLDVTLIADSNSFSHRDVYHVAGSQPPLPDGWRVAWVIRRNLPTPAEPAQSQD